METSLSVRNDAVLKSARRWIIAAYVWQMISLFISYWGMDYIIEYLRDQGVVSDSVSQVYLYKSIFYNLVLVTLFLMFFIRLRSHSNVVFQQSAKILLIAVIMNPVIMKAVISYFTPFGEVLFFIVYLILRVLDYYLFIMAYSQLNKCYTIKKKHLKDVVALYILTFIDSAFIIFSILFILINWNVHSDISLYNPDNSFLSLHFNLESIASWVMPIAYIICWKHLLNTPSDIPVQEEMPTKISFVPSKIEIGYLVSSLLFAAIVYATIYQFTI